MIKITYLAVAVTMLYACGSEEHKSSAPNLSEDEVAFEAAAQQNAAAAAGCEVPDDDSAGLSLQFPGRQPANSMQCAQYSLGAALYNRAAVVATPNNIARGIPTLPYNSNTGTNTPNGVHPFRIQGTRHGSPVTITGNLYISSASKLPPAGYLAIYGRYEQQGKNVVRTSGHVVYVRPGNKPGEVRDPGSPGVTGNNGRFSPTPGPLENGGTNYTVKIDQQIQISGIRVIPRNK